MQNNFLVQTGDPTNTGKGGESIYGVLYGEQARFFEDEIRPHLKHSKKGTVGMASVAPNLNASQFYITTSNSLHSLDERHTIFGEVAEGLEILEAINDTPCDTNGRPLQNIRIRHSIILDDPTPDPPTLLEHIPEASPPPQFAEDGRLEDDWRPADDDRDPEHIEREAREAEARNRAVVLEMIGDLPEADVKPPSNMLFVCKLNPVTTEEDLEIIFSRFGIITSCDIIRDWKTGDSLCYAFIGFSTEEAAEQAYFKMHNVLIDDRRIKVDFSQSVAHLWKQYRKGGKRGDASLAAEAESHQRNQRQGGDDLELKDKYARQHGRGYDLVLNETGAEPLTHSRKNGGRYKERSRSRDRDRVRKDDRRRSDSRDYRRQR